MWILFVTLLQRESTNREVYFISYSQLIHHPTPWYPCSWGRPQLKVIKGQRNSRPILPPKRKMILKWQCTMLILTEARHETLCRWETWVPRRRGKILFMEGAQARRQEGSVTWSWLGLESVSSAIFFKDMIWQINHIIVVYSFLYSNFLVIWAKES